MTTPIARGPVDVNVRTHGVAEGPLLTDLNGELEHPVLVCSYGAENRCVHFGVHDWHYFYCAAQDAPNKHAKEGSYAYPWRSAGKQLPSHHPDAGCPFVSSNGEVRGASRPAGEASSREAATSTVVLERGGDK